MRRHSARIIRPFSKLNPRCKVTAAEVFHTDNRCENQRNTGDDVHGVHCAVLFTRTDTSRELLLHGKHNRHQRHLAFVHNQRRPQEVVVQAAEGPYHFIQNNRKRQGNGQFAVNIYVVCAFDLRAFVDRSRLLTEEGSEQEQTTDLTTGKVGKQITYVGIAQAQVVSHEGYQNRHTHDGRQQHNGNIREENRFLKVEFFIRKDIRQNRAQKTV